MIFHTLRQLRIPLRALGIALSLACAAPAFALGEHDGKLKPVAVISDTRLTIETPQGNTELPLYLSSPWDTPQAGIVRAVIVVHGKLRNADTYFKAGQKALAAAEAESDVAPDTTLLIAPQFLATIDTETREQPADVLRWDGNAWMGGEPATGNVPLSSFTALDAIVTRLADRRLFPNLRQIVIAGHSGGAQVVQRYAVAMHENPVLAEENIGLRFLVANPSSYAYFDAQRPAADGVPAPYDAGQCPGFDQWKYGMQDRPAYVNDRTPQQLEQAYAARPVTYLIGADDHDPAQAALDKSCAGEAQGPHRMARGMAYYHYLQMRHPGSLNQSFHVVPGVGHNGTRMLTSACAVSVMFGDGVCKN
jgi:hypothetical protein